MRNKILFVFLAVMLAATGVLAPVQAQEPADERPTCAWLKTEDGAAFAPEGIDVDVLTEGECVYLLAFAGELGELYPLVGERYVAHNDANEPYAWTGDDGPHVLTYRWTLDGWLWPPALPESPEFFQVAFPMVSGVYGFNGVQCWLKWNLDGDEEFDPPAEAWAEDHPNAWDPDTIVGRGNGLEFTVIATNDVAYAWVGCSAGPSSGFSIEWLGPLEEGA